MSRGNFGWSLPPGVTQRMIDEAIQEDPPTCYCEELLTEYVETAVEKGKDEDAAYVEGSRLHDCGDERLKCRVCLDEDQEPDPDALWDDHG